MADARREHEFDVAVSTICYLTQAFAGKFRPHAANPFRREAERVLTPREREEESQEGWAILKAGLVGMVGARG
jgi:hypothetical protein